MDRVVVIGTSCSGKSTFAHRLAEIIDAPWYELDRLHWLPGWEPRPLDEFRRLVAEKVSRDRWVIDGNYGGKVEHRLAQGITYPLAQLFLSDYLFSCVETYDEEVMDKRDIVFWQPGILADAVLQTRFHPPLGHHELWQAPERVSRNIENTGVRAS
ncbi:MAG: hypothetical protein ACERK1_08780 [Anaerolineales bacterium]